MPEHSPFLSSLSKDQREDLEKRLLARQSGRCFICDEVIDLDLLKGQLDIDHIVPLVDGGPDDEQNLALTHASCNRRKGSADLRVARRMAEFDRLQEDAQKHGSRGVNLGDLLARYGGATTNLRLKRGDDRVEFALPAAGETAIHGVPLYLDSLSGMAYCFAVLPLQYLHHDDRINPRTIGSNVRALIEEFMKKRPQLQVALAWWSPDAGVEG